MGEEGAWAGGGVLERSGQASAEARVQRGSEEGAERRASQFCDGARRGAPHRRAGAKQPDLTSTNLMATGSLVSMSSASTTKPKLPLLMYLTPLYLLGGTVERAQVSGSWRDAEQRPSRQRGPGVALQHVDAVHWRHGRRHRSLCQHASHAKHALLRSDSCVQQLHRWNAGLAA